MWHPVEVLINNYKYGKEQGFNDKFIRKVRESSR